MGRDMVSYAPVLREKRQEEEKAEAEAAAKAEAEAALKASEEGDK
jgi:hypothetical protein